MRQQHRLQVVSGQAFVFDGIHIDHEGSGGFAVFYEKLTPGDAHGAVMFRIGVVAGPFDDALTGVNPISPVPQCQQLFRWGRCVDPFPFHRIPRRLPAVHAAVENIQVVKSFPLKFFRGHGRIHGTPAGAVKHDAGVLVHCDSGDLVQEGHLEHTGMLRFRQVDCRKMVMGQGVDQEKGLFGFNPLVNRMR